MLEPDKYIECFLCGKAVDISGLYVVVECDPYEYFHPDCFLDSEWYDESGMDRMVIDAHKNKN